MTKIKIFASDDLEKLVSDLNEFIEKEVDGIVDIRYESFPVFKRYNSSGVPTVASILDRVLIMYEPKQEDQEDDNKPSYNPVEKAYFLVKDLNERVSSSTDTIDGHLEEILGYLGEALE